MCLSFENGGDYNNLFNAGNVDKRMNLDFWLHMYIHTMLFLTPLFVLYEIYSSLAGVSKKTH